LGSKKAEPRWIDVRVKRSAKVALFLAGIGAPIDWHITPSPETQISTLLLLRRGGDTVYGLDASVPVKPIVVPGGPGRQPTKAPCYHFWPTLYGYLGGPAALALDESLKVVTGHGLDRLVRDTNDGSWPPASPDAPRVSFEID
jgi:hypothetical protein